MADVEDSVSPAPSGTRPISVVEELLAALAVGDEEGILSRFSEDVQGIDEISRGWLRGKPAMAEYVRGLLASTAKIASRLDDVHEVVVGDAAFITCRLSQWYELDGEPQAIEVPSTFGLLRSDGRWLICLFHSVPMAE